MMVAPTEGAALSPTPNPPCLSFPIPEGAPAGIQVPPNSALFLQEEDPFHPKIQSVSHGLKEIHMDQVRPIPSMQDPVGSGVFPIPSPIPIPILIPIPLFQPVPLSQSKRPFPCMEKGSQMSAKMLKLECDQEAGPSHPKSHWEFQREPGPSTSRHNCARDTGGHRECHRPWGPLCPHPVGSSLPCLGCGWSRSVG